VHCLLELSTLRTNCPRLTLCIWFRFYCLVALCHALCSFMIFGTAQVWLIDWTGLDWTGLDWTGLDWTGLDWTGLDWLTVSLDWTGLTDWLSDWTRLTAGWLAGWPIVLSFNPLDSKGNYSAISNNMKLVNWPLMGGLLHWVQWGGAWAGCGPAHSPLRCTKCNSPPINGQCTNYCIGIWWYVALQF